VLYPLDRGGVIDEFLFGLLGKHEV
jgi:hypothetical protein